MAAALHEPHENPARAAAEARGDGGSRSEQDLADLVLAFNLFPAQYAHPTWLSQVGHDAGQDAQLGASALWIRALSAALLKQQDLHEHFDVNFADPGKRLALLDSVTLSRIAGLASAALMRNRLRRVVKREEVHAVQACMGVEAHLFAVRWQGPLPAVGPIVDGDQWPSAAVWRRRSVAQLFTVMPVQARGVTGRLRLRFPRDWTLPDPSCAPMAEPLRGNLARLLIAIARESAAQWSWLFEMGPAAEPAAAGGVA